jgi:serine protease AprX
MNLSSSIPVVRKKAVWGPKRTLAAVAFALIGFAPNAMAAGHHAGTAPKAKAGQANSQARRGKLDHELTKRSSANLTGSSRVIITLQPGAALPPELKRLATKNHGRLGIINGHVLTLSNRLLKQFASHPAVSQIDLDRPIAKHNFRTSLTVGARPVQAGLGLTGAGVGVAVVDSGIATWHDDLTNRTATLYPFGNQRLSAFVDFVTGNPNPYDDDGHGTHVAGIIAGNGYDSLGQKAGVAPDASLVSLKVLDANGSGTISNIIAAFDWIVANHDQYNIRVVNLSVGAGIYESYWTDPLTLAAKRVVDAGVAVVVAAGNLGKDAAGLPQYGGITAPGNAPWVITVGASSTIGTADRSDDTMAGFSSRGPTWKDFSAKPDLVAPGVGTISLASPLSTFYTTKAQNLLPGSVSTPDMPYLALSGTSMAAPVVTGTIALMMQANPALTPNLVKAILQYTAQPYAGYDSLTQGAGFLNTLGAVRLAQFFATAQPGAPIPTQSMWGKRIIWGNHLIGGGIIVPTANAFLPGTNWGAVTLDDGANVVWGTECDTADCGNVVWGTSVDSLGNVVWGTSVDSLGNVVWGTSVLDDLGNVVWGTDCGTDDCNNVVWGTADGGNVVWGTAADSLGNVIWGTACDASGNCDDGNIVWGTDDGDGNVTWGTDATGNIVWGTADEDNVVWGTDDTGNVVWGTVSNGVATWYGATGNVQPIDWTTLLPSLTDQQVFDLLKMITITNQQSGGSL